MIIMSVDLGKARTGIAVCDKTEFLASPYTVIFEKSPKVLPNKVAQAAEDVKAELIVVGLPKNMDGSEGESAQNARAFAETLRELTGIETVMQDERGPLRRIIFSTLPTPAAKKERTWLTRSRRRLSFRISSTAEKTP